MVTSYTAKYTKTSSGYMGQLVEWPEVITEGKDIDECRKMLKDAAGEMIQAYKQEKREIPAGGGIIRAGKYRIKYTVLIREAPDGYYDAGCPLVPEAHAQGKSYDECLYNIREALELCIEYRKERGEEIPDESKSKQVFVTL